ncbi:MAG: hypothetical protein AAGJ54_09940 [Planctomycetota bacterium]
MAIRPTQPEMLPYNRAEQQQKRLLKVVRAAFLIAFITVTVLTVLAATDDYNLERVRFGPFAVLSSWWLTTVLAVIFGGLAFAADRLTPNKKISTLGAIFFGLVVALLASFALGSVIDLITDLWDIRTADGTQPAIIDTIQVLLGIGIGYICISTVLQTKDDFRLVIPYVEFAKQIRGPRPLLIDSSTLVDGRIVDIAGVGILQTTLIVPRFVAEELQLLADNPDASVRSRGRRGLQTIAQLQGDPALDVVIDETLLTARGADRMLVDLAQRSGAMIATTDTGLAAVAEIDSIPILNIHTLAKACKPVTVEGESFQVRLVRAGEQPGQAVGYLDDGTMVVVNHAEHAIGSQTMVSVESTIPTAAGRMIFASLIEPGEQDNPERAQAGDPDSLSAATTENHASADGDDLTEPPAASAAASAPHSQRQPPMGPNPHASPSQRQRAVSRRNPRR